MNPSTALATVIVSALADLGVRQVVLCPGSRSAPLAYALAAAAAEHRITLQVRLDERSAGFLALGLSKGSPGAVTAIVTTSGTAVANLHPAVLEAAHAGLPLLVISADRPHELRGTGASQTTDQVRIFGPAVRWFGEVPAPQRQAGLVVSWRNVVARAVAAARGVPGGDPGPVQLNVAFADPLTPDEPDAADSRPWPEPLTGTAGLTVVPTPAPAAAVRLPTRRPGRPRTVVLAGDGAGAEAAQVAAATGWPLLAEPSSGARTGGAIVPYRLLLERPGLGAAIERVVVYGRPTLTRPVTALLARPGIEVVIVSTRPDWTDAARRAALVVPHLRVDRLGPDDPRTEPAAEPEWTRAWRTAGIVARAAIDRLLDEEAAAGRLTGPLIAREVAAATAPGDTLFAGSSNPIRDLDLAAGPFDPAARVLANRGLAGIDGTLASASGVALTCTGGQVRALVGDLTFLHDVGGLLVGPLEERPNLQIVVVDDDGGGIFSVLEHGARGALGPEQNAVFERVFATPQRADLGALCAGYGVGHQLVDDASGLRKALSEPPPGTSVIQIRVDRAAHRDIAHRLRDTAAAAADAG